MSITSRQRRRRLIQSFSPKYRVDFSKTTQSTYWMNHCDRCGAKQGDFAMDIKHGRVSFLIDEHILDQFDLHLAWEPFVSYYDSVHGAGSFDFSTNN